LARALASRGHDVAIIVLFSGGSTSFPVDEFPSRPIFLEGSRLLSISLISELVQSISKVRPDMLFAINQSALVAATLAQWRGAPVPHLACRFSTTIITSLLGRIKLPVFKWCTARADTLVFVSLLQRDYWESRGMTAKRVVTIQNGISTDRFRPPTLAERSKQRKLFGIDEKDTVLVKVGRLAPEKNHAWLIRTLAEMLRSGALETSSMRLVVIGEGPQSENLKALAVELGIGDIVIFAGGMRDITSTLAIADVGVLVSNSIETFSHAALELMCSGLPMVMTDIGGASEIIVDGETGFLIPVGDTPRLQEALQSLHDPELRQKMGTAARARVLEHFAYDMMLARYEALLPAGE
jgi:glycosyltransferase involved in cell wall biosynthesis